LITCARGIAKIIPTNHKLNHAIIIHKKINNGLIQIVFFIIQGISILFSSHWIQKYHNQTTNIPFRPNNIHAINTAGIDHKNGHIYGINSVNHAIKARDNI
jgi:hypothetical protein